jgi:amino acid adenylation domain-containing protein
MFAAVSRRTPEAVALITGDLNVSYRELNRRANALAGRLRTLGVGMETPVAVRLGRSTDLVVALLAILKAGGVYVPVEPATPPHRSRVMLRHSACRVLVTRTDVHDPAVTGPLAHVVLLDAEPACRAGPDGEYQLDTEVHGDNLAYITFTSGSSGQPKAVGTTHRSAVGYLRYLAEAGYLTQEDTTLQLAAPSFDASIRDILGPLTVGARVVLVPDEFVRDADVLQELLVRQAVSCVPALVPATLRLLCGSDRSPDRGRLRLRRLLVSGEVLTSAILRQARDRLGADIAVVNHYGPTECTMTSTFHLVDRAGSDPVPVGRPPRWSRVYLLDDTLSPVPTGTIGEIYLGGAGVTRGYLNQPELTAARFLPDPFAPAGARMYRTGDLGRFNPEGLLEFHGRVDAQLNINGVRIEPGEIEATLQAHESVSEAAVAAVPGLHGGGVLVGYVVAPPGRITDSDELREFARSQLPDALVPKAFIVLPALPRTSRGKLDRAALAAHHAAPRVADGQQPRTTDEAAMLAIWRDVLQLPDLGIHDDLFDLGGDSILAMSLVSRIRRAFGRAPALADVFREPTVAATTRLLPPPRPAPPSGLAPEPVSGAVEHDRAGSTPGHGRIPLSFAQQRLWFFEKLLPGSPLNTIAAAFRVDGALDADALSAATRDVMLQHEPLRSTFGVDRGQPTCQLAEGIEPPFDVVPELRAADQIGDRINALARQPLEIERGPLLRVTLFDGAVNSVLLVRVHHLVADARSLEILLDDLAAGYRARRAGGTPELPPSTHSYADYTAWQSRWLTDERTARQLEFWRTELAAAAPLLELPADHPRPPVQRYHGTVRYRTVPPGRIAAATALGRAEGASLFMVLLAAWAALLARYSGQDDLVIGVPVTGRSQPEFDRVVGLFVNTLPVRVSLTGAPTFRQLLRRVRDTMFRALAHRDFPFERLVEQLRPERSLAYGPVFQTLADLQRAPSPRLPGVRLTPVGVDTGTARFDISLSFLRRDTELVGAYTFNTDLFEAATVERIADHYETLLAGALAAPDQAVSALSMLGWSKRRALTARRRAGPPPRHVTRPVPGRARSHRRPGATPPRPGCGDRRQPAPDLRGPERRVRPSRRTAGQDRHRRRVARGYLRRANPRAGGRAGRHSPGRCSVSAARPCAPRRPAGPVGRRRAARPGAHPTGPAGPPRSPNARRGAAPPAGQRTDDSGGGPRGAVAHDARRRAGLRHLHLRLHRRAEGRRGDPRRAGTRAERAERAAGRHSRRHVGRGHHGVFRHRRARTLPTADDRRPSGARFG